MIENTRLGALMTALTVFATSAVMAASPVLAATHTVSVPEGGNRAAIAPVWAIQPTPSPGAPARLYGVSCPAAGSCVAVGYYTAAGGAQTALAEIWDGTAWAVTAVPQPAGSTATKLDGVSCTAAGSCVAVGSYSSAAGELPMIAQWNGTAWALVNAPTENGATGTVCTGSPAARRPAVSPLVSTPAPPSLPAAR
jgi:hypothetical protein